ncbi:MAG: LuxR family transcriptional regulator [Sphingomonadales bacterium]|nr:LuxR family transcriptional regulator [Sphingomonadales bacterium]
MRSPELAQSFIDAFAAARNFGELEDILAQACTAAGFRYYALTQHADFKPRSKLLRMHNYPEGYAFWFDARGLGKNDPVHRASQLRTSGFRWSDIAALIDFTADDELVFAQARACGIGDGFTVPGNVTGELSGSISFAVGVGEVIDHDAIQFARLVSTYAFDRARVLSGIRPFRQHAPITLRQRACLLWSSKGKTDEQTASIMGISRNTVLAHMRAVRETYDSPSRLYVVVVALFEGTICFSDILDA